LWRDTRHEIGGGLGSARGFAVVPVNAGGLAVHAGAWRAVRRHRL